MRTRPECILIVEDDPAWAALTREAFAEVAPDVEVEVVTDGDAAVARMAEPDAPATVLLDLNMPGTDGRDVLRAARQAEGPAAREVIVLSASMSSEDRRLAASLGASAYVNKPTTFSALCTLAASVVAGSVEHTFDAGPEVPPSPEGEQLGPSITHLRVAVVTGHDPGLGRRLQDAGFDVRPVRSVSWLGEAGAIDCVVIDLDAPGNRRAGAVQEAHDLLPGIPIVALLGVATAATELAVLAAGAADVVPQDRATQEVLDRTIRFAVERATLVAELERQHHFLQAVIDDVDAGIVACGADGRLQLVNAAAAAMHGRTADRTLRPEQWSAAYRIVDLATREPVPPGGLPLERALAGERVVDQEVGILDPTGDVRRCTVRGRQLRRADGEVLGAVVLFHDVTEQHAAEEALTHQALHDPLTGLPNRTAALARLEHVVAPKRVPSLAAVLFVDLDRFKEVNDVGGHEAGDRLLADVAQRLLGAVRPEDTVARLGGDEFIVIAESMADATAAMAVADRVHLALAGPAPVKASIGLALVGPGMAVDDVLREADLAMYRAKRRGGGTTEVWTGRCRPSVAEV